MVCGRARASSASDAVCCSWPLVFQRRVSVRDLGQATYPEAGSEHVETGKDCAYSMLFVQSRLHRSC
jgi:hypothetical protein